MDELETSGRMQDLHENIAMVFERYKETMNLRASSNTPHLLYDLNIEADLLQYKIKYEVDQYLRRNPVITTEESRNINSEKAKYLITLQTLSSTITSYIINDCRK